MGKGGGRPVGCGRPGSDSRSPWELLTHRGRFKCNSCLIKTYLHGVGERESVLIHLQTADCGAGHSQMPKLDTDPSPGTFAGLSCLMVHLLCTTRACKRPLSEVNILLFCSRAEWWDMKLGSHNELLNNEHCFCLQRLRGIVFSLVSMGQDCRALMPIIRAKVQH